MRIPYCSTGPKGRLARVGLRCEMRGVHRNVARTFDEANQIGASQAGGLARSEADSFVATGSADLHGALSDADRRLRPWRIVLGEGVVPHGGPKVVALHAQDDFENFRVERAVEVGGRAAGNSVFSEFRADPEIEIGLFIIEEDAAVFDAGLTLLKLAGANVEGRLVFRERRRPTNTGRDADLVGKVANAENGAALVAAGDDQRTFNSGLGVWRQPAKRRIPLTSDAAHIDLARAG